MGPKVPWDIQWIEGELPDVHTVPKDCCVIAWFVNDYPGGPDSKDWKELLKCWPDAPAWDQVHGHVRRIECCHPWENDLNPLRWCDSGCHPIGWQEKVKYWAWLRHPMYIGKLLDDTGRNQSLDPGRDQEQPADTRRA